MGTKESFNSASQKPDWPHWCLKMNADAILSPPDRLIHYRPSWNPRIGAAVVSAASFRAVSYSRRDKLEKCSHFQAVQMTFSHDNSELDTSFQVRSSRPSQKALRHLLYLWPVVLVARPSNKYRPGAAAVENIGRFLLCHHSARMASGFWWDKPLRAGKADDRRASVRPHSSESRCGTPAGESENLGRPLWTFSKHNQMNWSPICQREPAGCEE